MNIFREAWFKLLLLVILGFLVFQISLFLHQMAWGYSYSHRAECLNEAYKESRISAESRYRVDPEAAKRNCFDIISKFNP
jgi:hypothetical protein